MESACSDQTSDSSSGADTICGAPATTRISQILSEASIGKAYPKQMNIRPWRALQPEVPNEVIGLIMSTYFGGRAEVHLRRTISQVLYCDFLSMYPTVCTLMGLWRFVIAKSMTRRDATIEATEFLNRVTLADLQKPESWPLLTALIQIVPNVILPVRARYSGEVQATIGLNHLSSNGPLWFTLADCVASKILTGKPPKPGERQDGLNTVSILGNDAYRVHPATDDFYRRLIDLRGRVKEQLETADPSEEADLDSQQQALKILANATSYGIFVELIVEELDEKESRLCFGSGDEGFRLNVDKVETPLQLRDVCRQRKFA
jgi:DNA polymerase family B